MTYTDQWDVVTCSTRRQSHVHPWILEIDSGRLHHGVVKALITEALGLTEFTARSSPHNTVRREIRKIITGSEVYCDLQDE